MRKGHSIKLKITLFFGAVTIGTVLLILFLNNTFSESYYQNDKQKSMLETYERVDFITNQYQNEVITAQQWFSQIRLELTTSGMAGGIVDSEWESVYYFNSNKSQADELVSRLQEYVFGGVTENEILSKSDTYVLQKVFDQEVNDDYLELWGTLPTGDIIIMRLPIQSIRESVQVTSTFIQYVGIAVIIIGLIIVYLFSGFITKPIKELSKVAEKMSELDFNVKYTGKDKGELGLLGNSMNHLSEKLKENISQLKAANIELKKDIESKIQIDELRKDFLSNVSHELKTPIALIQGYAEGLKEGVSQAPDSMEFYCDVIIDEANKMNNMVQKLLTLNQLEAGNEELLIEQFDLTELIRSIVNVNEIRAVQDGIKIIYNETQPLYVWADEYKIEEVVTNYISNAIHHCEEADHEKYIHIAVKKNLTTVRVSVFNTGTPIPKEDIGNIWIKFYKVDKARTREYGGSGIGLSIVKAIMDSYDKECGVINHSNGVEFWFELDSNTE